MSAFSNCNGPSCCGGGNTLPQVITLEQLLHDIQTLQGQLTALMQTTLPADRAAAKAYTDAAVAQIQNQITTINGYISALQGQTGTIDARIAAAITTHNNQNITDFGLDRARIQALETQTAGLQAALTALTTSFNNYKAAMLVSITTGELNTTQINAATLNLSGHLKTVGDLITKKIYLSTLLDYTKWATTPAQTVAVQNGRDIPPAGAIPGNGDIPTQTLILGMLSEDWSQENAGNKPVVPQDKKAFRAMIKFTNTRPWDAIVDGTASFKTNATTLGDHYRGAVRGLASKTDDREIIRFGLFKGTDAMGNIHVYLGVWLDEFLPTGYVNGSGLVYRQCGINYIPYSEPGYVHLNGSVEEIAYHIADSNNESWFESIRSETNRSDEYLDEAGHGVAITDEVGGTLTIGDSDPDIVHQIIVNSTDRPIINIVDRGQWNEHHMAFLSDLAQSVYFQRSVQVIVEKPADLQLLQVLVDNTNPNNLIIVGPNYVGTKVQMPGIYYTDPAAEAGSSSVSGTIFGLNLDGTPKALPDVALVKYDGTENLVDSRYNGVLNVGTTINVPLAAISGTDDKNNLIVPGVIGTPGGTTVIDDTHKYGKVTAINATQETCTIESINAAELFPFSTPAYYTFTAGAWAKTQSIEIPKSFDGLIRDITYQWAGNVQAQDRVPGLLDYFVPSYETWTSMHEDSVIFPEFGGDPWADINIPLAGYRGVDRQDEIDTTLRDLSLIQADYAERVPVIPYSIPERPTEMMPNPAFINNKPWVGTAILDSGSFVEPNAYHGWLVEGGDFSSSIATNTPPIPPVGSNNQFRNTISRIWRGLYVDMPEITHNVDAVWTTFAYTLRWCQFADPTGTLIPSTGELWFQDLGLKELFRFIPLQSMAAKSYVNEYKLVDDQNVTNKYTHTLSYTDANPIGVLTKYLDIPFVYEADAGAAMIDADNPAETPNTLSFVSTYDPANPSTVAITSPRIARIERNMLFNSNANFELLRELNFPVQAAGTSMPMQRVHDNLTTSHVNPYAPPVDTVIWNSVENPVGYSTLMFEVVDTGSGNQQINISSPRLDEVESGIANLDVALQAETTRAMAAESQLDTAIAGEIARATGVEATLNTAIQTETTRATFKETELADAIAAETLRAETAEAALDTALAGLNIPGEPIPVPPTTGGPFTLQFDPGAAAGAKFTWV